MAIKLYHLKTNVKSPSSAVVYPEGKIYNTIYDFAVAGKITGDALPVNLIGRCQSGISAEQLTKLDYLHSFGGIPIFSNKLIEIFGEISTDLTCIRTTLISGSVEFEFNIVKIIKRTQLVDYARSGIGSGNFLHGTYFRNDINLDFLIARENNPLCQSIFAVSERFKKIALKHKVNVLFKEVAYA